MPRLAGQVLLVAGSTVGAGLLALPAVTYASGFVPSCAALVAVWMYMSATALLLIEATARHHRLSRRPNMLGMAQSTLGSTGRAVSFALYILIYAATLTAYISEGGRQAATILKVVVECLGTDFRMHCSRYPVPPGWVSKAQCALCSFFAFFIYCGAGAVERLNSLCMIGAMLAFCLLVRASIGEQSSGGLGQADWGELDHAVPVMIVAFSYHNIVPSVFSSLGSSTALASKAVLLGSALPLMLYIIWQAVVLGSLPNHGVAPSAADIFNQLGDTAGLALPMFSLLAVITSLLGVVILTFFPCLTFALYFPNAFLPALEFSGVFRQILFGAVPILMVMRGRHQEAVGNADRAWKDQPVIRKQKSWSGSEGVDDATAKLDVLPLGAWGLSYVAAMTALLLVLELNHTLSR